MTTHLTEVEIQLYVAEREALSEQRLTHVELCPLCQASAANYALLFESIHNMEKPAFDFDLSKLVMSELPTHTNIFPWSAIFISLLSISAVVVSAAFFWSTLVLVIKNVSGILLAISATGASVILVFQLVEMLKAHQKNIDALFNQKTLQL
jgi:hypothetical protein